MNFSINMCVKYLIIRHYHDTKDYCEGYTSESRLFWCTGWPTRMESTVFGKLTNIEAGGKETITKNAKRKERKQIKKYNFSFATSI